MMALDFISPSVEAKAADGGAAALRRSLIMAASLFGVLLLLAAFVPMDAAVIGHGQVGLESRVKRVSHPGGGVVTELAVRNGDHVRAGQVLVQLDNRVSSADATYSSLSVDQLMAQQARLEAERSEAGQIVYPAELASAWTPSALRAMADESRLFAIRREETERLRSQLRSRIEQLDQNVKAVQAQIASLEAQRRLIEPELRSVRELWDQKLVTISRANQMERTAVDLEGNVAAQQAQIAQLRARISETREQLIQLDATKRSQAGEELARVNGTLNEQRMRQVAAVDQNTRSAIRAPYAGVVEKMVLSSLGEVVRPAEPIMEIVPDREDMVIEASVSPIDIDQVRPGQAARIRFSAFNLAATPEIPGRVIYVATDRSDNPEARQSFYMVRVAIDQAALRRERLDLRSGMPAEVYIRTGRRALLTYLTKPLRDQFVRAFLDN